MKAELITIYRDGGTQKVLAEDGNIYYIDGRPGMMTTGKVFHSYPGYINAKIANVKIELINHIKK